MQLVEPSVPLFIWNPFQPLTSIFSLPLNPNLGNSLSAFSYDYLKSKNAVPEGEYILIAGWPVQVLVPNSPLVEEALQEAVESDVEGESAWVFRPEHLAAIALQTGRGKDKSRLLEFIEQDALDTERFLDLIQKHHLTDKWETFKQQFLGADKP